MSLCKRLWTSRYCWYGLAALLVLLDQLSKCVVLGLLSPGERVYVMPFWNWVLAYNSGAAFSFLADAAGWQRGFLTVLALAVSAWLVWMLRQHATERVLALALSLILGGALGNVIDRIRLGAVVDFVQWHVGDWYWPAFNLADAAITLGAVLMLVHQWQASRVGR